MRFTLLLGTLVLMFAVMAQVCSCEKLSLSGPKKYKVAVSAITADVRGEIQADGEVKASTTTKIDKLLSSWEAEMGTKESYVRLKEVRELIEQSKTDANPFNANRDIQALLVRISDALAAEIR